MVTGDSLIKVILAGTFTFIHYSSYLYSSYHTLPYRVSHNPCKLSLGLLISKLYLSNGGLNLNYYLKILPNTYKTDKKIGLKKKKKKKLSE
jgi:hypothetical protein